MQFITVSSSNETMMAFRGKLERNLAVFLKVPESAVRVLNIVPGSVVATVAVDLPKQINADSAPNYLYTVVNSPSVVYGNQFKQEFGISGPVSANIVGVGPADLAPASQQGASSPRAAASAGSSEDEQNRQRIAVIAGLVCGLGTLGIVIIVASVMIYKKRRDKVIGYTEIH